MVKRKEKNNNIKGEREKAQETIYKSWIAVKC